MRTLTALLTLVALALATAAPAQGRVAELKRELTKKERAAKSDVEALVEVARWAQEHGLTSDKRRILEKVLKDAPDHEKANVMLGNVRFEGEWMSPEEATQKRAKAREAEFKEKGYVQVSGVWVEPDRADAAKDGVFWHDGQRVSRSEKLAFNAGMVRHPRTGQLIDPNDLDRAESGQFPLGDGRWVDEAEADEYHSASEHPWIVRTKHVTIVSQHPIAKIAELSTDADAGYETATKVFGGEEPKPESRPVILLALDDDQYRQFGESFGAEGSAYSVFRAEAEIDVPGLGVVRPVACGWSPTWMQYWIRHAAAFGYGVNLLSEFEADAPLWFTRGVAGYGERFFKPDIAAWFGQRFLQEGGFKGLDGWFGDFQLHGGMEWAQMDSLVFQAALLLAFAMEGGDEKATEAMQAVTTAVKERDGRDFEKAMRNLEKALSRSESAIRDHLKKLTQ